MSPKASPGGGGVQVSVVIGSRNGAAKLPRTVQHVLNSMRSSGLTCELILVDSDSHDETRAVMEAAARQCAEVRVVALSQPGVSRARNAGIGASHGDVVLFTDDDVLVPDQWVAEMAKLLLAGTDAVAGMVQLPEPLRSELTEFQRELLADTAAMKLGDPPRTIVGASMGFRRRVFEALGLKFDVRLGPGSPLGYSEETLLHMQLRALGGQVALVDSAPVIHDIDRERVSTEMFRHRVAAQAVSDSWIAKHVLGERPTASAWVTGAKANLSLALRALRGKRSTAGDADLARLRRAIAARWWLREGLGRRQVAVADRWKARPLAAGAEATVHHSGDSNLAE